MMGTEFQDSHVIELVRAFHFPSKLQNAVVGNIIRISKAQAGMLRV